MSVFSACLDWTWIATGLIGLVTYMMVSLWVKRRGLPPGPMPLPLIGNLLTFRDKTKTDVKIAQWREQYGDVFTIWMGPDPMVVVCGWDKLKDGLVTQRNTFAGRKVRTSSHLFLEGSYDVMISDYGPRWETLRKLIHSAVRKYSTSEKLPILVDDVVKQITTLMVAEKEAFDPNQYTYLAVYNILATTAFGVRYDMNDEEFLNMKKANDEMQEEFNIGTIIDVFPILQYLLRSKVNRAKKLVQCLKDPVKKYYKQHKETYTTGIIRDFTDACLAAKIEVLEEENQSGRSDYFTDGNMELVILDLFSAGTDTTRITTNWALLYMANFSELQDKVRREIKENIGNRMPVQEDKYKCPYTIAFITEILRVRPVVSFTIEHKAIQDGTLDNYKIPNQTSMIFHIFSQHMDPEFWKDPTEFRPERFLEEDGTFMTLTRFTGYLPFGLGRRACPGEKLALADLFLILSGLVQKVRFSLPEGPGSADLEPQNVMFVNLPKPFKLKVEKV